jgi:hypothetical protein
MEGVPQVVKRGEWSEEPTLTREPAPIPKTNREWTRIEERTKANRRWTQIYADKMEELCSNQDFGSGWILDNNRSPIPLQKMSAA